MHSLLIQVLYAINLPKKRWKVRIVIGSCVAEAAGLADEQTIAPHFNLQVEHHAAALPVTMRLQLWECGTMLRPAQLHAQCDVLIDVAVADEVLLRPTLLLDRFLSVAEVGIRVRSLPTTEQHCTRPAQGDLIGRESPRSTSCERSLSGTPARSPLSTLAPQFAGLRGASEAEGATTSRGGRKRWPIPHRSPTSSGSWCKIGSIDESMDERAASPQFAVTHLDASGVEAQSDGRSSELNDSFVMV